MKNYVVFVNDHSWSMKSLAGAALKDYNANVNAVVSSANKERLDTVVSVLAIGLADEKGNNCVKREVVISNPHVLEPKKVWPTTLGTPLYDGIGDAIDLLQSLPDYENEDVSFLVIITTDGMEQHSRKYNLRRLQNKIAGLKSDPRWTLVCRTPHNGVRYLKMLGIPEGNIQTWDTSVAGLQRSTETTTQAVATYFRDRKAGAKASKRFFSNVEDVDVSALTDISKEVSLYVVPDLQSYERTEIQDFILEHRQRYLKGAAFYQLVKTEARVGHKKLVIVRDRNTGKFYSGKDARAMLKLPNDRNVRVNPGDHGKYDIFIQSESTNRLLPRGTGVVYWEKVGVPFTEEDLNRYKPKTNSNGVVELPSVVGRTKPTPSPVPVKKQEKFLVNGREVVPFSTRRAVREYARKVGKYVRDAEHVGCAWPDNKRWFVYK